MKTNTCRNNINSGLNADWLVQLALSVGFGIYEVKLLRDICKDNPNFEKMLFDIRNQTTDVIKKTIKKILGIKSSAHRRNNMKIQSKRAIKSGTSNFGSNDDVFGYSFPLVTYIAENYYYDEETDSETEERDYEADNLEYRDAIDAAKYLADEMDIPQYDDYSEPYLCHEPFMIKFRDGYYEGLWIEVKEGTDEEDIYNTNEYGSYYDGGRPFTEEQMNKYADKLNKYFNKLCSDYGWQKLGVSARFDNGETWYSKIDNSHKPIKSEVDYEDSYDQREFDDMVEENGYDVNERFTYMAGIQPEDWTDEDSKQAEFYDVDVAGYYKLGDAEGMVLVGTLKDIYDYCDNYLGMGLHPDYVCPADSFDYEDGEWVTGGWIDSSVKKPIKSERDKTFWNISNGYLTGNEVMKIINEIDDWCAHRALTHSDIRGYSENDVTPGEASDSIREIITYLEDLSYRLDEYNMADDEDIQNGDFDDLLPMIDDTEDLCKKLLTEETYSRMYNDIFKDLELVGNRDFELTSSRKSIKSGMSYQQVLDEFTAGGKPWDDYWSMQYDWTTFVDGLERDDLVDYNEARWWDNPCTPETFREWKNS